MRADPESRCWADQCGARFRVRAFRARPGMTVPSSLPQISFHFLTQPIAEVVARHAVGDVGAEEAGLRAAIMPLAFELDRVEVLRFGQPDHGIGELDLAAGAALLG